MLEEYFAKYRKNIIGENKKFESPYGEKQIIYSDWTASGRIYGPVEDKLSERFYPMVGNTHTETNVTGSSMTVAYHKAMNIVKKHVNASAEDVMISSNSGMTGVVNKFQRILGLKVYEKHRKFIKVAEEDRPIVFITHMEHHSNQTSWLETLADVEIISPDKEGYVDLNSFAELLEKYKNRKTKYAAITSCSNVTGIITPYFEIAEMIHAAGGYCFVDFACSAPYIDINMHPKKEAQYLDAIFFSPHKFLGGPGTAGVLIFNKDLYTNEVPDNPGGGTVDWTNPWGLHKYLDDIEMREDGGTPAFLQTIKTALCVKVKEEMGTDKIKAREEEQINLIWDRMKAIAGLHILADNFKDRLGVLSFYIDKLHYNLGVRLLNDRFGIQMRGGCSCAGTYGHYLLHVDEETSNAITSAVTHGDMTNKPGWIRMSIHPTMPNAELEFIVDAVEQLAANFEEWGKEYAYDLHTNEFNYKKSNFDTEQKAKIEEWFEGNMA
ncbi:MAG: aminotransferase class V-fold PLP-dependent enzyme [Cyclobacteriaceae bacterium]|nr:aminotransferase class V-fold PLP-dependent enzyme [Cyclobacteriaceae bacterium]